MESIKTLIATSDEKFIKAIKSILQQQGFEVIDTTTDGYECLRKARILEIDIVIVGFDILPITGYEISKILVEDDISDVILIAKSGQEIPIKEVKRQEGITLLTRPISKDILIKTIEIMAKSHKRAKELRKEIFELKEKLSERKVIEKAKGIIIKTMDLSEQEAFRFMQKQSMDKRKPIKELAQEIINHSLTNNQ